MEDHNNVSESNGDEEINSDKDQKLESAKGEMGEVKEENERLRLLLARLVKDYQSLQMDFFDILKQDKQEEATKATGEANNHDEEDEESELVSLSLGMSSKVQPTMDEKKNSNNATQKGEDEENLDKGLALGLDIRFDPSTQIEDANNPSPESSFDEEGKEEELTEIWPPSKVLKTMKTGEKSEASQHTQLNKARVSIRARCDTQTMNDGCQWRKYGQKIAKGNPCPRAYYRCTLSPSCPVRKQVQRCAEDMSILITTYEGTHNHSLPISAAAMASTTSAAASMLQSPSLSSQQGLANSNILAPIINSTAAYNPNALNFSTSQISRPHQFYFPHSSISASNSHPTITLDLTAPPTNYSHAGKFSPAGFSYIPKYSSSTNLNFSSSFSPLQSSMPMPPWSTYSDHFNSRTLTQNRNQGSSSKNTGKQPFQGHLQQPNYYMSNHTISQQSLSYSIAAATKAITTNPNFQSALATALTTYVGNNGGGGGRGRSENHVGAESVGLNLKLGGDLSYTSGRQNGIGSSTSSRYLNMSPSALNAQQGNMIILPQPPPLPPPAATSKSASASPSNRSNQLLEQWK